MRAIPPMGDDVAVEILDGRLDPGHERDVAREVQSGGVFSRDIAVDSVKKTSLVSYTQTGIARAALSGEGTPHVGAIGIGPQTAAVGDNREGARIGRCDGGF